MNKYKSTVGFQGEELESIPNGFTIEVIYGIFDSEDEAKYCGNDGHWMEDDTDTSKSINADIISGLILDENGFGLEVTKNDEEDVLLRLPEFELVFKKFPDGIDASYEKMELWNIEPSEVEKLIKEKYPNPRRFDSLFYGAEKVA